MTVHCYLPNQKMINQRNSKRFPANFFRNNNCKHGASRKGCRFSHPKVCRKLIKHGIRQPGGCNKGRECAFFHPVMCLNSLRKNKCFDDHCHLKHVRGTIRNHTDKEKPAQHPTESQITSTPNQHFLDLIQTLRSEMDTKINAISMHIQ